MRILACMARRRARQLDFGLSRAPRRPRKAALARHAASVDSRHQDWLRDSGDFDPAASGSSERGLTDGERRRALSFARRNNKRNGVYGSILDKLVDHTLGDGVELTGFEDAEVEAYVRGVLGDRRNRWDEGLEDRWRDTLNEGEYLLAVETQRRGTIGEIPVPTGLVRLGRFEVDQIRRLRFARADPDDLVEIEIEISPGLRQWFPVARPGVLPAQDVEMRDGEAVATGMMTAICYWSVARLAGRGTPRLKRIVEKAELVDDVVDANARKADYLNRFWLTGEYQATGDDERDEEFEESAKTFATEAEPGSFFLASKERAFKLDVFAPDLKILDQKALFDMTLEFVLGSEGFPRMWFASSGETNRASAIEQGSPIHRMLVGLQARLQGLVTDLVSYLVWLGKASGRIRAGAPEGFSVVMASIATRDTQREIGTLQQLQSLLVSSVQSGLLHEAEAQAMFRQAVAGQTMFEASLEDEPPAPGGVGRIEDVLNRMPSDLREAVRKVLPGHRRR